MKLQIELVSAHDSASTCLAWISYNTFLTCGDDHLLHHWSPPNTSPIKSTKLPENVYPLDISIYKQSYIIACSDGNILLFDGSLEKTINAHKGGVLCIKWNPQGIFASGGEDGLIKIWSSGGMLRSTLVGIPAPIYCLSWTPLNDAIIFTNHMSITIKYLTPTIKPITFKAHNGIILKIVNCSSCIISAGEDCRYKIFDYTGRLIYTSDPFQNPITSIAITPDESTLAVGSFNLVQLSTLIEPCSLHSLPTQSILNLAWSPDSTHLAGTSASGKIFFATIIQRSLSYLPFNLIQTSPNAVTIKQLETQIETILETKEHLVNILLAYKHLILVTLTKIQSYSLSNLNIYSTIELKHPIKTIVQGEKGLILIDPGISLYNYEGRHQGSLKWIGQRVELLTKNIICLCGNEYICAVDVNERFKVLLMDFNGKLVDTIKHKLNIVKIAANKGQIAIVDKNCDCYLVGIKGIHHLRQVKICAMVKDIVWNEDYNILAGYIEGSKLLIWLNPISVFIDSDLLPKITLSKDLSITAIGEFNFHGSNISINGTLFPISPFIILLHEYISSSQWSKALALVRLDSPDSYALWATLAGASLNGRDLYTAEIAYSFIDRVDRVTYIQKISSLPNEAKAIELALLLGNFKEAEALCEKNSMWIRLVMIHCEAYLWDRARKIAKGKGLEKLVEYSYDKYVAKFKNEVGPKIDEEYENLIQNQYQRWNI